jgi:tRNA(adenine34) deaminase
MSGFEFSEDDNQFMREAVEQAKLAYAEDEVPIGAVVVLNGEVIGRGRNAKTAAKTAISHAEITALEEASKINGDWRLDGASLYVTVEPCLMCAGAIIHARVKNVVFGVSEPKFGGVVTLANTFDIEGLNHKVDYKYGLFAEEIRQMMKEYFRELRKGK